MAIKSKCSVPGCDKPILKRSLGKCAWHTRPPSDAREMDPRGFISYALTWDNEECLFWPFAFNYKGYGFLYVAKNEKRGAHRTVCERKHGPAPSAKHLATHTCNKGHLGCVNPRHLRWGTPKSNSADMAATGELQRGSASTQAILTESDIPVIRARLAAGETMIDIGDDFGVARTTISGVKHGYKWGWLE